MASPDHTEDDFESLPFDPAQPLKGIIVCCTSIPPDQRTSIASKVAELGGVHKYDLTPDVTHLIVGDYDTPKYRHVARERSDIKVMDAAWIEALSELWKKDDEIDFGALESEHQLKPLEKRGVDLGAISAGRESLLICLTGFGDQRDEIARQITSNGGIYTGDLTRRCSHLIVSKPEGKKFVAAKAWGIHAVTLEWLTQSIARGLILEETKFDPILPAEEQGKGAWVKRDPRRASLGKRSRSLMANGADDGPRKLRKTASMKLTSQRNNLWGDILGRSTSREYSFANEQDKPAVETPQQPQPEPKKPEPPLPILEEPQGVFGHCYFYIHGFTPQRTTILEQTISTLGGSMCSFLHEAALGPFPQPGEPKGRFLIVPQASQPDTHPRANYDGLYVVTEYYIEKCLHNKSFFDPNEHVLGRPFPLFPIPGFSDLTICTAAFTGIELNQVARGLAQLGAKFEGEFRRGTSVLICKSLASMRKEKLRMALKWNVPAVSAEWLWECVSTGYNVPLDDFVFPELKKHYEAAKELHAQKPLEKLKQVTGFQPEAAGKKGLYRTQSESALRRSSSKSGTSKRPIRCGFDITGFDQDSPDKPKPRPIPSESHDSLTTADFATARTHPAVESFARDSDFDSPLAEVSNARLNKSPPSPRRASLPRTLSEPAKTAAAHVSPPEDAAPEDAVQDEQRKQQAEDAQRQAKAAERQALTSKLSGLIGSMGSTNTSASHNSAATDEEAFAPHPAVPRPRRRQILGRAISNVSNASSDAARSDSLRDSESAPAEDLPRPTQLEYHDPRAEEVKAALMNRMMGGAGEIKPIVSKGVEAVAALGGRLLRRR